MPRSDGSIRVSTDTLEQSPAVDVGSAIPPVTVSSAASTSGAEPDEYPIDFAEWAAGTPSYYRTLIAGFEHETKKANELLTKKMRAVWDHAFKVFCGEAKPNDAPAV